MNDFVAIFSRFRKEKIALAADIESMYYQVQVSPRDCDSLRFLWWPDGNLEGQPVVNNMKVHFFGATSSPCCQGLRCVKQPLILALNLNLISVLLLKNIFMLTTF